MTTYNVYTYSKNGYGICVTLCRKAMTKEDAIAFKALHKLAEANAAEMMARLSFANKQVREGRKYTGDITTFINDTKVCAEVRRKMLGV